MVVTAKPASEEQIQPFGINKVLFEEANAIKGKLTLIKTRLEKMDQHRGDVSDQVFLKVKSDYETQMDQVQSAFEEKCQEVEKELQQLYLALSEEEEKSRSHHQILEEAKFRHVLGEYSDKKFKDVEVLQNKEIKKYSDLLDNIKGSIQQYESILGHPYLGEKLTKRTAAKAAPISPPTPIKEEPGTMKFVVPEKSEKVVDLDMFLEMEGDYFSTSAPAKEFEENKPAKPEVLTKKKEATRIPPPVSKTEPVNDSVSEILRNIPLEPSEESESSAPLPHREPSTEASLLLIEGDLDEHEFILGENFSIGRSASNDMVLKEPKISRQHSAINFINGNYVIVDLKSSNGVFVNGKKVEEAVLKDGDEISLGSFKFRFSLT